MAINFEELRKQYDEMQAKKGGNNQGGNFSDNFLMVDEGQRLIRILPPKNEDKLFYAESKTHRVSNGDGGFMNIHCREFNEGQDCPLCNLYHHAWAPLNKEKEANTAFASSIKPKFKYYMNVLDRDTGKVKIWTVGVQLWEAILQAMLDPDFGDVTDLEKGHDFKLMMRKESTPKGTFPKFDGSAFRPGKSALGSKAEIAKWMDEQHDLESLVKVLPYEEILKIAQDIAPDGLDPTFRNPKRRIKSKVSVVETAVAETASSDEYLSKLKTK